MVRFWKTIVTGVALAMAVMAHLTQAQDRTSVMLAPATMKPVGTIGDRHQSYNVEMLEVTGGKFWKPYKEIGNPVPQPSAAADGKAQSGDTPAGMSADLAADRSDQPAAACHGPGTGPSLHADQRNLGQHDLTLPTVTMARPASVYFAKSITCSAI
jgi:hypothetical protein